MAQVSRKKKTTAGLNSYAFWLRPTFPQFRKRWKNGKESHVTGRERPGTVIVKYDVDPIYEKWRELAIKKNPQYEELGEP